MDIRGSVNTYHYLPTMRSITVLVYSTTVDSRSQLVTLFLTKWRKNLAREIHDNDGGKGANSERYPEIKQPIRAQESQYPPVWHIPLMVMLVAYHACL